MRLNLILNVNDYISFSLHLFLFRFCRLITILFLFFFFAYIYILCFKLLNILQSDTLLLFVLCKQKTKISISSLAIFSLIYEQIVDDI